MKSFAAALSALAFSGALYAHHASILFDLTKPIWIAGTVVRYELINPHIRFELEVAEGAQVRRWTVEGPFIARLKRMGVEESVLKLGDTIEVCGFPLKGGSPRASSGEPGAVPSFVHGHVLVLSNGRLRSWGPYGKIDNCVRPGDRPDVWLGLLDTDELARNAWCDKARAAVPTRPDSKALVDAISRSMANPCGSL